MKGSSSIEETARKWGIPVFDYRALITRSDSPVCYTKCEDIPGKAFDVKRLKAPFIKVEDTSRKYRVDFVEMNAVPFIDLDSQVPDSPFETWYRENEASSDKIKNRFLSVAKKCELCQGRYYNLKVHLSSARHNAAARDDSLFTRIDNLIARGPTVQEFIKQAEERSGRKSAK